MTNAASPGNNLILTIGSHISLLCGVAVTEDVAKAFTLVASDPDGDALTYIIISGPSHGTLSGTAPNLTYTPAANYNGSDSFTFKVNDGTVDSKWPLCPLRLPQ